MLERETRFELATSTLARLHSTTELFPLSTGEFIPPSILRSQPKNEKQSCFFLSGPRGLRKTGLITHVLGGGTCLPGPPFVGGVLFSILRVVPCSYKGGCGHWGSAARGARGGSCLARGTKCRRTVPLAGKRGRGGGFSLMVTGRNYAIFVGVPTFLRKKRSFWLTPSVNFFKPSLVR